MTNTYNSEQNSGHEYGDLLWGLSCKIEGDKNLIELASAQVAAKKVSKEEADYDEGWRWW